MGKTFFSYYIKKVSPGQLNDFSYDREKFSNFFKMISLPGTIA